MKTFAACTLALVASDLASAFTGPLAVRSSTSVARASSSVCMSVGDEVGAGCSPKYLRDASFAVWGVPTTARGGAFGAVRWGSWPHRCSSRCRLSGSGCWRA